MRQLKTHCFPWVGAYTFVPMAMIAGFTQPQ